MKILVTGGNGFIGRALTERLLLEGYSVRILTRKLKKSSVEGVEIIEGDLVTGSDFSHIVSGCDAVINCAGEVIDISRMHSLHVDGTKNLLKAFKESTLTEGVAKHWIQLSSVGAYGPALKAGTPRIVTEETPHNPQGEYEVTKTLADELVIASADISCTYTILRPSNVVGPTMPNQSFAGLIKSIKRKLFFYIGTRTSIATYVHVQDVVSALVWCLNNPAATNQIFNLSNDCRLSQIVDSVLHEQRVSSNLLCLPEWFLRVSTRVLTKTGKWPLTDSRIDALISQTTYPTTKIEALGFKAKKSIPNFSAEYSKTI